ncbi:hypothetical protein E4Z66_01260 [Aliishimia ponticola]|uniref:Phytanoyl-CoA dioxygenase n=1 Tax=Aliishimia ponticola TaxID=2499833 RepID=A0A4V3XKT8_9RHOB|nr:hypothetical protein [Aliishimia ponticola]THH38233.1 hypothetical protein E4Z66_01260 [Aliishimia ponticola]
MALADTGAVQFAATDDSRNWARAAYHAALRLPRTQGDLRHGRTWFPGVDALPNAADGSVDGVALRGPWQDALPLHGAPLHRAQLSIVYPGYPQRDPDQSEANHRYRVTRCAAHVDGLLPDGPDRRRFAREFHAYILGIHLNDCADAPTVFWPGSHRIVAEALRQAIGAGPIAQTDITEAYHEARRKVFDTVDPKPLQGAPGAALLLHRFTLHGTAPWTGGDHAEGRMTAFFRPEFPDPQTWLNAP